MRQVPPPLRFLAAAVGGWLCLRAAMLFPDFWSEKGEAAPSAAIDPVLPAEPVSRGARGSPGGSERPLAAALARTWFEAVRARPSDVSEPAAPAAPAAAAHVPWLPDRRVRLEDEPAPLPAAPIPMPAPVLRAGPARWSASAWLLVRRERSEEALAPGGTLGGSQAGARFLYRINRDVRRPLALSARLYMPLRQRDGAEAAAGLDWRPLADAPLHLLAERRQALGRDGRSAFSITFYGGHSGRLARRLQVDAYGQAGMVGIESRDAFVDGAVRIGVPAGPLEIGGGAWAAAQPGLARLDIGPQLSVRLPGSGNLRLRADWRFRIAGDAAPASGPAITLAGDF